MESEVWKKSHYELRSLVRHRVRDTAIADDIVQEVLLKAFTRIHQLKDSGKLANWMSGIAKHAIADHFRNKNRAAQLTPTADMEVASVNDDTRGYNDCVASCLQDMLPRLPEKYRLALELTDIQNISQTDLATRFHISYSGAKSRVQRARTMLREMMDESFVIRTDAYGNVLVCEDRKPVACHGDCSR